MSKNSYHVIPVQDGSWGVKRGGASRASKIFDVKNDAVVFGRQLSSTTNSTLVIHRKDGTIQNADSYGNDPNPPKDKK
jgi:hypothetical protein